MHFPILTSLIALPIVGSLALLFLRDDEHNARVTRRSALVVARLVVDETLHVCARCDSSVAAFHFVERHACIPAFGIAYAAVVDGMSVVLLVLTGPRLPLAV